MIFIKPIIRGSAATFTFLLNYLDIFGERWQKYQHLLKCAFTNLQMKLLKLPRRVFGIFHWQLQLVTLPRLSYFIELFKVSFWPTSIIPQPASHSFNIDLWAPALWWALLLDGYSRRRRKQTRLQLSGSFHPSRIL